MKHIPYICMDVEQLTVDSKELNRLLNSAADNALKEVRTLSSKQVVKASEKETTASQLLIAAAELSYIGQRTSNQILALEAREAIRKVKALDSGMPDAVIGMFDADDIMPEDEPSMDLDMSSVTVDKSKSDIDQTWKMIQTYVTKIKEAIKKLNERINKQIHENLRNYMKSGKVTAAALPKDTKGKGNEMQKQLPRKKVRKKAKRRAVKLQPQTTMKGK